jgi:hypothetical protein
MSRLQKLLDVVLFSFLVFSIFTINGIIQQKHPEFLFTQEFNQSTQWLAPSTAQVQVNHTTESRLREKESSLIASINHWLQPDVRLGQKG